MLFSVLNYVIADVAVKIEILMGPIAENPGRYVEVGVRTPPANGDFDTVKVKDNSGEVHTLSWHAPSGTINNNDSVGIVRFKCAGLAFIGTKVATVAHILRSLSHLFFIQYALYKITGCERFKITWAEARQKFCHAISDIFLLRIFRYGVALEAAAVRGIVRPKEMRFVYANLETRLNRNPPRLREGFYIAPCFQELANVNNRDWLASKRLDHHILRLYYIRRAYSQNGYAKAECAHNCSRSLKICTQIPRRLIAIPSRNIASPEIAKEAFAEVEWPMRRHAFQHVGRTEGLRVCRNIRKEASGGHCVGMSMKFLSSMNTRRAAELLSKGADDWSATYQAVYNALLNGDTSAPKKDLELILKTLYDRAEVDMREFQYPAVAQSVKTFLESEAKEKELGPCSLRKHVLEDLEGQNIEITPEIYALVQEVSSHWVVMRNPDITHNQLHDDALKSLARYAHMTLERQGPRQRPQDVDAFYKGLAEGRYLLMGQKHAVALIKTAEGLEFFDNNSGYNNLSRLEDQREALTSLFKAYCSDGFDLYKVSAT